MWTLTQSKKVKIHIEVDTGAGRLGLAPGECLEFTKQQTTLFARVAADIKGDVNIGDEVAIFDNVNVTVEEMADICGTIGYEIISQIEDKAERVESF
jgi:alanine racemase